MTLETPLSSSPLFQTQLKTVRPGKEFELQVACSGSVSNASPQGSVTIKTSCTSLPMLTLHTAVMPQPALVAMPSQIQLPAGPLNADYHFPATIRNNSRAPLTVSDPVVNAKGVTVQLQEVEPGKTFKLDISFGADFDARPGQPMELAVKTSHPKYPVFRVPIMPAAAVSR